MRIQVVPYGSPMDGVAIEWRTLDLAQRLIEQREDVGSGDIAPFWTNFFEFSNLAELLCLQDKVFLFDDDAIAARSGEILAGPIAEGLREAIGITRIMTIDDVQRQRIFRRWELLQRAASKVGGWQDLPGDDPDASLRAKPLLAGIAIEELVGVTYFPSLANATNLMQFAAVWSDATTYSVIANGYAALRMNEIERRRWLRSHGAGVRQLPIPPITALLLSRVTTPEQIVPTLIDLRGEFQPLREKTRHLRELAATATAAQWESEYEVVRREVAKLLRQYGGVEARQELNRFRPDDAASLEAKLADGEDFKLEEKVDVKRIIAAFGDTVLDMIRRRQVKPLPSVKRRLDTLPSLTPRIEKVFGINVQASDLSHIETTSRRLQEVWSFMTSRRDPEEPLDTFFRLPRERFRTGEEAMRRLVPFHLEAVLREYLIITRAASDPTYSRSEQLTEMAFAFHDVGDVDRAERLFQVALDAEPAAGRPIHGLASIAQRRKEPEKARALYEEALLKCDDPMLLNDAGAFFREAGELDRAAECFTRAIAVADELTDYLEFNAGWVFLELKRYEEALEAFNRALSVPNTLGAAAYYGRGCAAHALGHREEAIADWERASGKISGEPELALQIGAALLDAKRYDSAAATFQFGRNAERPAIALMLLGAALYLGERYREAADVFAELDALEPGRADVHRQWAYSLYAAGDPVSALEHFREAVALDSSDATAAAAVTKILFKLGRSAEALVALDQLLSHEHAGHVDAVTHYDLGVNCDSIGEYTRAVRCYELSLLVNGDDPEARANLAADLMELGRNAEALPHAERSCELAPQDPINWNNLAAVRLSVGNHAGAIDALQRVIDLGGGPLGMEAALESMHALRADLPTAS